jgi:hypothetical protein
LREKARDLDGETERLRDEVERLRDEVRRLQRAFGVSWQGPERLREAAPAGAHDGLKGARENLERLVEEL